MKINSPRIPFLGFITNQSQGMPLLNLIENAREKLMKSEIMSNLMESARDKLMNNELINNAREKISMLSPSNQKKVIRSKQRRAVGWTLLGIGLLAAIPLVTNFFQSRMEIGDSTLQSDAHMHEAFSSPKG